MTCFTVKNHFVVLTEVVLHPPPSSHFFRKIQKKSLVLIIKKIVVLAGKNSLKVNATALFWFILLKTCHVCFTQCSELIITLCVNWCCILLGQVHFHK